MKFFLILILSFSALADISLSEAYKREKSFLIAQKEALLKMKSSLNKSLAERKNRAQKEIEKKQIELSSLLMKNNELHEEFKLLEKMTKESSQMAGQLEKNALKIQETLASVKSKLGSAHFRSLETDPVKKFEAILDDSLTVINDLSSNKWRVHAFLDENDHLVQGEVMFQGLFSAWGRLNGKIYSLVPYNNEFLKVAQSFSGKDVYLFSPDFERSGFKSAKTWKETVADAIPGLVMMMIMICVLGLFILLARA